jgi:Flp pilus assembly protein TadB
MAIVLPVVAGVVIVLVYFGLFANPLVILAIFVLYVAVSLRNKRKFRAQEQEAR